MDTPQPLAADELSKINAYWRAANYLAVGQIYLYDNPLLREPLRAEHEQFYEFVRTRSPGLLCLVAAKIICRLATSRHLYGDDDGQSRHYRNYRYLSPHFAPKNRTTIPSQPPGLQLWLCTFPFRTPLSRLAAAPNALFRSGS